MLDLHLPAEPRAAAIARRCLERLSDYVDPAAFENVRLLVSELVTNSVRHGDLGPTDWIDVRIETMPHAVKVLVSDPGVGFEPPKRPSENLEAQGWGLLLVERLADRWGVSSDGATRVWFEIDRLGAPQRN